MMELDAIRTQLKDRRVAMIAQETGLHFNTIREVRDNADANPTYRVMQALTKYLESTNV